MLAYMRGFVALFVVLMLLLYLPPGKSYQKYIRFFAEMILALSILSPVLSIFCDSTEFLERIEYAEFTESLSEISKDMEKIEYINNDNYIREYKTAIEEDIRGIAGQYAAGNAVDGASVQDVEVQLGEDYTVKEIRLWMSEQSGDNIVIGQVILEEGAAVETNDAKSAALKQKLSEYYQLPEDAIKIQYTRTG